MNEYQYHCSYPSISQKWIRPFKFIWENPIWKWSPDQAILLGCGLGFCEYLYKNGVWRVPQIQEPKSGPPKVKFI